MLLQLRPPVQLCDVVARAGRATSIAANLFNGWEDPQLVLVAITVALRAHEAVWACLKDVPIRATAGRVAMDTWQQSEDLMARRSMILSCLAERESGVYRTRPGPASTAERRARPSGERRARQS